MTTTLKNLQTDKPFHYFHAFNNKQLTDNIMRNIISKIALVLFLSASFVACEQDENLPTPQQSAQQVEYQQADNEKLNPSYNSNNPYDDRFTEPYHNPGHNPGGGKGGGDLTK